MKTKLVIAISMLLTVMLPNLSQSQNNKPTSGYAQVNELKMYYEVMGRGNPIILLHGAYMTIEGPMREIATELAKSQKVYLVEMQAHGRTNDAKRDITYEGLADDVAAFAKAMKIDSADVLGYSMGAGVAIQLAIRHPQVVKKIIAISGSYSYDGMQPALEKLVPSITPAMFEGSPMKKEYDSLAPNPKNFPVLVEKLKKLDMTPFNWESDYVKIKKPLFLIFGDSDATTIDHIAKMLKGLGGNVMGDLAPMPQVQLAVLPRTSHMGIMSRLNYISPMVSEFLTAGKK
jgi:pimeloyl-ACP methyl ester carboxylesterase